MKKTSEFKTTYRKINTLNKRREKAGHKYRKGKISLCEYYKELKAVQKEYLKLLNKYKKQPDLLDEMEIGKMPHLVYMFSRTMK